MPRLLFFLACERAIISQEDNSLSIVSVLTDIVAETPFPPGSVPANAAIPLHWYLVTCWSRTSEEILSSFEQRTVLESEDGQELLSALLYIEPGKSIVRGIVGFMGFPVSHPGNCVARVQYREAGAKWTEVGTFPIKVNIKQMVDKKEPGPELQQAPLFLEDTPH